MSKLKPSNPPAAGQSHPGNSLVLKGLPSAPGIAIGPVFILNGESPIVDQRVLTESEVKSEVEKFHQGLNITRKELEKVYQEVRSNVGEHSAQIFEVHLMLMDDKELLRQTERKIEKDLVSAEFAFSEVMKHFSDVLAKTKNPFYAERAADIRDLKLRVLHNLGGTQRNLKLDRPSIMVAKELMPSDTMLLDRSKILGFVSEFGGRTSHASILARALEVPSVVGARDLSRNIAGCRMLIVDGSSGEVILDPSPEVVEKFSKAQIRYKRFFQKLDEVKSFPAVTLDKHPIQLSSNIDLPGELDSAIGHRSQGVGLLRTEFLFLGQDQLPDEQKQFLIYDELAKKIFPNQLVIRTLDSGGDKVAPEKSHPESNPFLGWRAIRFSLDHPEIFKIQLRAILRASRRGNVKIMFPMISHLQQLRAAKHFLQESKKDLRKLKIKFDPGIQVGIMVEIPSAAVIADLFAGECDFLSIGTNDLVQYSFAVDRGNEKIARLYTPLDPALLRLVRQTIEAGHRHRIPVAMCGDMAGDPLATVLLVGMGIDQLSMIPILLGPVKQIVRNITFSESKKIVKNVYRLKTSDEIYRYLHKWLKKRFPMINKHFGRMCE